MRGWLLAFAAGCGNDYCERAAKVDEDCGVTVSPEAVDACRDRLDACTAQDLEKVDAWFACQEDAGANECDAAIEALDAGLECRVELEGLTDACDLSQSGTLTGE